MRNPVYIALNTVIRDVCVVKGLMGNSGLPEIQPVTPESYRKETQKTQEVHSLMTTYIYQVQTTTFVVLLFVLYVMKE